jgi:hypothetical protein
MKKPLVFFLFAISSAFGQKYKIDEETKLITYSEVIEVPSVTKDELYRRANLWLSKAFRSGKAVTDLQDKEAGKIIAKGYVGTTIKVPLIGKQDAGNIRITIAIDVKDGKYRYIIDNLTHEAPLATNQGKWFSVGALEQEKSKGGLGLRPSNSEWRELKENVFKSIEELTESLKTGMTKAEKDF